MNALALPRPSPLAVIRKYAMVAIIDWQSELAYRANSLIWIAWSMFHSLTMMVVWLAAYQSREQIAGYRLSEMMTYYFIVTFLSIAVTPNHEWELAASIREGQVTSYLVRPIDYFWFRAMTETAYQVMKTMMAIPGMALMAWLFREHVRMPQLSLSGWAAFILSCALMYGMLMCIKSAFGFVAFWFGEVGGILEAWNIIMMIFSGRLLPVSLLPSWLQGVGDVLPFQWLYPLPMNIALGRISSDRIAAGLATQAAWMLGLYFLMRWVWRRGVRAYEGYGG